MRERFYSSKDDVDWLKSTHLAGSAWAEEPFGSFLLYGNEDDPERLDLFAAEAPLLREEAEVLRMVDGRWISDTFVEALRRSREREGEDK